MATRERAGDRGRRRLADDLHHVRLDIGMARRQAGLSLRAVARAARVDHAELWRFERGEITSLAMDGVSAAASVVGLDLRVRAFPQGDAMRDAGQLRLLERLRTRLHPTLRWRTEVPLPVAGDLRAWDAVISGEGWELCVEAETVLSDFQASERRIALKARDGGAAGVLIVVADTPRNRRALRSAPAALASYRCDPRSVLSALAAGRPVNGNGLVFL